MAKKTNKTSHVLNLITGSQPPVPASDETQKTIPVAQPAAREPAGVPSKKVTVVDPREEGKLAEEIQKNLIRELEKEQTEAQAEQSQEQAEQPQTEAKQPQEQAEQPQTEAEEPQTEQPETEAEQPQEQTEQPETEAEEPQEQAEQPETEAEQPQEQTEHPETEAEQPQTNAGTSASEKQEVPQPEKQKEQLKYRVVNVMEELLPPQVILDMLKSNDTCTCSRCQADVKALMLTRLQPKYIVADVTSVPMLLTYYRNKFRVAVLSQSIRACMEVKEHPRHDAL